MAHEAANIKWTPSTRVGLWRGLAQEKKELRWGYGWNYYVGYKPILFLHKLLPHYPYLPPPSPSLRPASASHGWSLMRSGGSVRERERERGGRRRFDRADRLEERGGKKEVTELLLWESDTA